MLVQCPECRKDVSDSAETCPNCGYRLIGRESLVRCPHCKADVIPEVMVGDFSRRCPICKRPVTHLAARTAFQVFVITLGAVALVTMLTLIVFAAVRGC